MSYLCLGYCHDDDYLHFGMGDSMVMVGHVTAVQDGNLEELKGVWKSNVEAWVVLYGRLAS